MPRTEVAERSFYGTKKTLGNFYLILFVKSELGVIEKIVKANLLRIEGKAWGREKKISPENKSAVNIGKITVVLTPKRSYWKVNDYCSDKTKKEIF